MLQEVSLMDALKVKELLALVRSYYKIHIHYKSSLIYLD